MKKMITLALTILSFSVFADPSIFGMELGKMTEKDLNAMYQVNPVGSHEANGGNIYSIPVKEISFRGLTEVTAIFNKQGYLVAVLNKLPKSNFDSLNQSFSKSYTLISIDNPFVGNKSAIYSDGATEITINSQHDNVNMSLNYINDELKAAINRLNKEEK
ncbi:MAG: hypothetical protein ACJAZP_002789 [Psychromonas sp.]|jgi:hypothetical protein|uniref:hypothetical protein n=1 Tax=Psychromonas sp. TaxID=1884585 RepID=UPI0039E5CC74